MRTILIGGGGVVPGAALAAGTGVMARTPARPTRVCVAS